MKAKRAAFLAAYRETGNVRVACEAAQISRRAFGGLAPLLAFTATINY